MAKPATKFTSPASSPEHGAKEQPGEYPGERKAKAIYSREQGVIVAHLRKAREEAGVTQAELAERLGFGNHSPVSKMESGQVRIDLVTLQRICRALGIPFRPFVLQVANALEEVSPQGSQGSQD